MTGVFTLSGALATTALTFSAPVTWRRARSLLEMVPARSSGVSSLPPPHLVVGRTGPERRCQTTLALSRLRDYGDGQQTRGRGRQTGDTRAGD